MDNYIPQSFVDLLKEQVSWLASHNNLTYQCPVMCATNVFTIESLCNTGIMLGLIDINIPLKDLDYYEITSVTKEKDSISNQIIFNVTVNYKNDEQLDLTLIPYKYATEENYNTNSLVDEINYLKQRVQKLEEQLATKE